MQFCIVLSWNIPGTMELHGGNFAMMMTSSNGNIFRVTGHLYGEFTGHWWIPARRPVTRSFDVFFDLHLNKRLGKQWWGWWFDTPSCSLWGHCNEKGILPELAAQPNKLHGCEMLKNWTIASIPTRSIYQVSFGMAMVIKFSYLRHI